jgi:alkylation response protein AidB-like acyl-CoA dehydrogenase
VTAGLSGVGGSYESAQLTVRWSSARPGSADGRLGGVARFVPDAHVADHLVVSALDAAGDVVVALVDRRAPGVRVDVEPTYDRTRRLARVAFDDVVVADGRLLAGPGPGGGAALHDRLVAVGAIAVVADAVGAAEHVLEISTAYAKERKQFGRAIGSFQAVKHHLADMFTDVAASRAAVAFAVEAVDDGVGEDLRHAAAVAKSFAGPACARVAELAVQVHGGIGFTWEHDAHRFLKRIKLDEALFGTTRWHRERLAGLLVDGEAVAR